MPVSIDISDNCIKIIEGEQQGDKIKISKSVLKYIDNSYIHNAYVNNKIDLTLLFTDIVNEYNLKNKECFLVINSTDIIAKEIILPKTKSIYLGRVIDNLIKELFGDTSNLCIDYQICEEFKKDEKVFYKIFVYSIPLTIMEDYREILINCGLIPKALDIKRNVIGKLLNYNINNNIIKDNITLFIDVTGNNMTLTLMSGNVALYKMDTDISEDIKREKLFLNKDVNKDIKQESKQILNKIDSNNLKDNEITFLDEQDYYQEEASFISPIFLKVYEEIHKIIQFSMSLNNTIERVYLYGDRDDLDEIAEYISNNITLSAEKIKEIVNIKCNEHIDISKFFIAIGNILRK
ncbi:pilus assembly protein PilM [[Clostridium] colinum]|uniref:pilus assembly protein PilM n=1 Tax=[Clostridium] colinum TaxID=36835 RepID=UPI002024C273|nr:pilus assembly protein PilM [[Clostridium] colinum]